MAFQRAPNPPEFAQPCLSRSKWHRSNTPEFAPSRRGNTSNILGTFWRPPTYRTHLHRNSGECGGPSPELWWMSRRLLWIWCCGFAKVRQGSPKFAWRGAHASGTPWNLPEYRNKHTQNCTLSLGMTAVWPAQTGLCKFEWAWSSLSITTLH